jgi:hypothetical protein
MNDKYILPSENMNAASPFSIRKDKGKYLQKLANATRECLGRGDLKKAQQCIDLAETLYRQGNTHDRSLIASVFVFSVSTFLEIHRMHVAAFFPEKLREEYYRQVNASGL